MLNNLLAVLKSCSIEHYLIEKVHSETAELFFIKKSLDMRRTKNVTAWSVTVYRDFAVNEKKMRGSSTVMLSPDAQTSEIERAVREAYESAQYVPNPTFELYEGKKEKGILVESSMSECTLRESAQKMAAALFASDKRTDAFLNSAELFVNRRDIRIVSSEGSDVGYVCYGCEGEFVVQCKEPKDVEQHFSFKYDDLQPAALTAKVKSALDTVCDRAKAEKAPRAGVYDVILSEENLKEILSFYVTRSDASMVYAKYSDYEVGKPVQGETLVGEALNLSVVPLAPYSSEGIPMRRRKLLDAGRLCLIHGSTRFCRYLGIEPTGSYRRISLENGTVPFEKLKKGCLYPVSFSDFQMDAMSGRFGGEIRLAYLYTDQGVEILTGGSINGSLLEKQSSLIFSKETYSDLFYSGPLAVKIPAVSVAGEE